MLYQEAVMSSLRTSNNRFGILIFNVLIFIMSLLVVITYASTPFFRMSAAVSLSQEDLISLVPSEEYPDADLESALPESLDLDFTLEVSSTMLFDTTKAMLHSMIHQGTLNADVSETADEFISTNLNGIVDQLMGVVESSIKEIAKSVAVKQAKIVLFNAIDAANAANVEAELASYDYNDEYFENKMTEVVDLFSEDDVTATQVSEQAVVVLDKVVTEIKDDPEITNAALKSFTLSDENKATLKTQIKDGLAAITDEDDKISVDLLKEDFAEKVMQTLPEAFNETFGTILKVSAGLLIFSMFTWIYLMIKIVCKFFMQNNSVKIKLPMWLGHIPGLAFWLLPVLTFYLIKNNPSALVALIPNAAAIAETVTLTFYSSGWLAVMAALILMIFAIPYCTMRRPLKRRKLK